MIYLKLASPGCTGSSSRGCLAASHCKFHTSWVAVRPVLRVYEHKKTGARSARGRSAAKNLVEQYKEVDSSK
jgi:hypothetical protein